MLNERFDCFVVFNPYRNVKVNIFLSLDECSFLTPALQVNKLPYSDFYFLVDIVYSLLVHSEIFWYICLNFI